MVSGGLWLAVPITVAAGARVASMTVATREGLVAVSALDTVPPRSVVPDQLTAAPRSAGATVLVAPSAET